jgi:hypothetical protein
MQKAGVPPPPSPGAGEWVGDMKYQHPLQGLWARLVTAPGTYEQGMLIDQLSNISRAESGADQKIGTEARKRFEDLLKELKALEAEFERLRVGDSYPSRQQAGLDSVNESAGPTRWPRWKDDAMNGRQSVIIVCNPGSAAAAAVRG